MAIQQNGIVLGLPVIFSEVDDGVAPANWFSGLLLDFVFTCLPSMWNGMVTRYEGSYWIALWVWLTVDWKAGDEP